MRPYITLICNLSFWWLLSNSSLAQDFVKVQDGQFIHNNQPYYFVGTNLWYGAHLGQPDTLGDRGRLLRELDRLDSLGLTNLRIMAASEGPLEAPWRIQPALQHAPGQFDENVLRGLDFLLAEMAKRDMVAILCLNNFFHWTGGMAQYVSWATETPIPYPHDAHHTWDEFQDYSSQFFANRKAQRLFRTTIETLVSRVNYYTGVAYREDPTIMAWQLANEPRGFSQSRRYAGWVHKTAGFLKKLDKNHLVSLGGEGYLQPKNGTRFERTSQSTHLDYLTCHIWIENWSWFDPRHPERTYDSALTAAQVYLLRHLVLAQQLNKPLVLEEFGISRDRGSRNETATTYWRDRYFEDMLKMVINCAHQLQVMAGANIWSWAGEERPPRPGDYWRLGDPLVGDPPHEEQGWYGIYEQDSSTLSVMQTFTRRMQALNVQENTLR